MLQFDRPIVLLPGLVLAALTGLLLLRGLLRSRRAARRLLQRPSQSSPLAARGPAVAIWLRFGALALLVFAAAGPRLTSPGYRPPVKRADVVFLLDVSASVWADDVKPSRLDAARNAILQLVKLLPSDRIALACFGGGAFDVCPLTTDHNAFLSLMSRASPDVFVSSGSSASAGLAAAVQMLANSRQKGGIILLLSDGEFHGESTAKALNEAVGAHVRIDAIGVGTPQGVVLKIPAAGGPQVKTDASGKPVVTHYHPETLKAIAAATGGRVWHYPDAMPRTRAEIVRGLQTSRESVQAVGRPLLVFALAAALILLVVSFLLPLIGGRAQ